MIKKIHVTVCVLVWHEEAETDVAIELNNKPSAYKVYWSGSCKWLMYLVKPMNLIATVELYYVVVYSYHFCHLHFAQNNARTSKLNAFSVVIHSINMLHSFAVKCHLFVLVCISHSAVGLFFVQLQFPSDGLFSFEGLKLKIASHKRCVLLCTAAIIPIPDGRLS